jgi:long-chain fatty acid transport protein
LLHKQAAASGFFNSIQSASSDSVATAGQTAAAEDASTIFYNPAGMALLPRAEALATAGIVFPGSSFQNNGSKDALGEPMTGSSNTNMQPFVLPGMFGAMPVGDSLHIGLGIYSPDGQASKYAPDWVGRYQVQTVSLETIDINPAIAWRVNDAFAVGGGIDIQYAEFKRSNAIDFGSLCFGIIGPGTCAGLGLTPQGADGRLHTTLSDWNVGFNVGVLFMPTDGTRIGVSYRSPVHNDLTGGARFDVPAAAQPLTAGGLLFANTTATLALDTPDVIGIGLRQQIDEHWTALVDFDWTLWSRVKALALTFANPAQPPIVQMLNWHDSGRIAFGGTYQLSDETQFRAGLAYDQSPIPNAFRSADLPDSDSILIGVGITERITPDFATTISYSHYQYFPATLQLTVPAAGTLSGKAYRHSDAIGLDARFNF